MKTPRISPVNFDPSQLRQLGEVQRALDSVSSSPISGAQMLQAVSLTTSPQMIAHKLGRTPRGWVVTGISGAANVWSTERTDRHISLQASAPVVVDLMVF